MDQVYWQDNERVDTADLNAIGTLADIASRRDTRLLAEPRQLAFTTDKASVRGCVVVKSTVTFATPLMATFHSGLELSLSSRFGGGHGDNYTFGSDENVAFAERAAPDDLYYVFMVKPLALAPDSSSSAIRMFYDGTAVGREVTQVVETRQTRELDWVHYESTDVANIALAESNGYQWVATLFNGIGPAPALDSWHFIFPTITNTVDYPGAVGHEELTSVAQSLSAIAHELARIKGGTYAWEEAISTNTLYALGTIVYHATIGNTALGTAFTNLYTYYRLLAANCVVRFDGVNPPSISGAVIAPLNTTIVTRDALGEYTVMFLNALVDPGTLSESWSLQIVGDTFAGAIWRFVVSGIAVNSITFKTQQWNNGLSSWIDTDPTNADYLLVSVYSKRA